MSEVKKDYIMLRNVRLSFHNLYKAVQFEGTGEYKYDATFIIEPGSENDKTIRAEIARSAKGFGKDAERVLRGLEGNSAKHCYISGDIAGRPEYAGKWVLRTKRKQSSGRPAVVDRDPNVNLTPEEGRPYSGCYVNAKVNVYAQTKGTGSPGIRGSFSSVQFYKDGDAFSGAPPATAEGFDVEADEEEESLV